LGGGQGWVYQNEQGQIDPNTQRAFAETNAALERSRAQAGGADSTLVYDQATGTYSRQWHGATTPEAGRYPAGWLTEQEIIGALEANGLTWGTDQMGSAQAQKNNIGSYTQFYDFDENGNPITRVGFTDNALNSYIMTADGRVVMDNSERDYERRMSGIQRARDEEAARQAAMPGAGGTQGQRDAYLQLQTVLNEYGLTGLNQMAWDAILNGDSQERILFNLRGTEVYKNRFKGMALRKAAGMTAISEKEYMEYERSVRQLMAEAGLPVDFYDTPDDFASLIGKDLSIREISRRTSDMFARAMAAPLAVTQAFADWFGADGTHALAMYFMNPEKALPVLEMELSTAEVGGTGRRFGINVGKERSEEVARLGLAPGTVEQRFAQIASISPLFSETITEGEDLTAEGTGVGGVFLGDQTSRRAIEQRSETRAAANEGGGGAALSGSGALGLQQDR
jgi:hypothetical protein